MLSPTTAKPANSLLCGSRSLGEEHDDHTSWWQAALRQNGTVVVSHDKDRSLSAGRACILSADGMTANESPFDGVIAVATKTHV